MKRILILGRRHVVEKNDSKQMAELLNNAELTVEHGYFEECVIILTKDITQVTAQINGKTTDVAEYDLVLLIGWSGTRTLSDIAHTIALYVAHKGGVCWNSELLHARSMTKLSQMLRAKRVGAIVPDSVFSLDHMLLAEAAQRVLTTEKVICKDIEASRGRRNELVAKAHIHATLRTYEEYPMIVQQFIENDGSDLRVVVAGSEPVLVIERRSSGDSHLTNTSQGGQATKLSLNDLPALLCQQASALSQEFGRELCGIDFMINTVTGQYIFLEINMIPQLVTGSFVDDKIYFLRQAIRDTLGSQKEV